MTTASTLLPATYPRFRYDGSGDLARIGLIYIASSVVMEEEMWACLLYTSDAADE